MSVNSGEKGGSIGEDPDLSTKSVDMANREALTWATVQSTLSRKDGFLQLLRGVENFAPASTAAQHYYAISHDLFISPA